MRATLNTTALASTGRSGGTVITAGDLTSVWDVRRPREKPLPTNGTFVTGVEVGLAVSLQVAGDVGGAQHLAADAAGHFAFVSDHVRTESVFGGESRGAGLRSGREKGGSECSGGGKVVRRKAANSLQTHCDLTFKRSF